MSETFDQLRDRQRRIRAVTDSVRADRHGKQRAEIAAELGRRLVAAGLPALPEDVDQKAAAIADLPGTLITLSVAMVRVFAGRSGPTGMRRTSRRLDGEVWIPVRVVDDPLVQRALRIFDNLLSGSARELSIGRIVALPSDDVAVFLDGTFIGLLPPEQAAAVLRIAQETDAADQKLKVKVRVAGPDGARTMTVALP
jgi:hypothetical protein